MHAKRDPQPGRNIARALVRSRESAIFLALILLMTVIGIAAPNFLGPGNLYLVSRQISFVAIVALGELFVILTGASTCRWLCHGPRGHGGRIRDDDRGPAPVCRAPWDSRRARDGSGERRAGRVRRDRAVIVTLGMLSFASGLVLGLTKGWPITDVPASFLPIAQGSFLGLPIPVWIARRSPCSLTWRSAPQRSGAAPTPSAATNQATFLSGIDVKRIKFVLYLIPAGCASVAGIILVARFNSRAGRHREGLGASTRLPRQ